jgi:predicted permease
MIVWRLIYRLLRHNPGFTAVTVFILALGIGSNTAMFSVINGVLLRPLSYKDPGQLFVVHEVLPKLSNTYPSIPVSAYDFQQWREYTHAFAGIALLDGFTANLKSQSKAERVSVARVSANLFPLLGIKPLLGRTFRDEEDRPGNDHVVILSNGLWRRNFQADPHVVGQTVVLDGVVYEIIGVAPPDIPPVRSSQLRPAGPQDAAPELWKPFAITQDESQPFGDWNYACIARLKAGVSISQAVAEVNAVEAAIDATAPEKTGLHAVLIPLQEQVTGKSRRALLLLLVAVFVVLLIACANIANLVLVRANARRRERAIQSALGATAGTLIRQSLGEGLVLAGLGGICGLMLAYAEIRLLIASGIDLPRMHELQMDWRALALNFAIAAVIGVFLGLLPAWFSSRGNLLEVLKSSGQSVVGGKGKKVRSLLVSLEVGLTTACLVVTGLLLHSFSRLMHVDDGFESQHVITTALSLPQLQYRERQQRASLVERVSQRLEMLPGVQSVGIASLLPLTGEGDNNIITVEGTATPKMERPVAEFRSVNPGFFKTLGIPLKKGRIFNAADKSRNVTVISEQAASRLFLGQDPIGKRFHLGDENRPLLEVVGVVGDVRSSSLDRAPDPTVYLPYWQRIGFDLFVAIRTPASGETISSSLQREVQQIDPDVSVSQIRTMQEVLDASVVQRRFQLYLVLAFAIIAMVLTGVGIYSVVSYSMLQRTNELGLRLALGASPQHISWLVLRHGMGSVMIGLAIGLAVSLGMSTLIRSSLFGVSSYDPWTFAAVAALLLIIGLGACFYPAQRATRMDPLHALHYE